MQGLTPHEADLAAITPARRTALIAAFADLGVFYATHPAAPVPDQHALNIRITGDDPQAKLEAVLAVARALGVRAGWVDGCFIAARQFGPLTLEAHYTPSQTIRRGGQGGGMDDREAARARYEAAELALPAARAEAERLVDAAHDEFEAAAADLRQYEAAPGIPLPQYRTAA